MKRIKQKRILFFSYVLTVLMCILITYVITGFSERVLRNQINETMFNAFSNTVTSISNTIDSHQTNMYAVLEKQEVVSLSNKYSSFERAANREAINRIIEEMNIQFMNQNISDEHYICFDNKDIVIGLYETATKETAYKTWFSDVFETEEEWRECIFSTKNFIDFVPFVDKKGNRKTAIIQKSIRNIGAKPSSVVISFVDERRLFEEIAEDDTKKTVLLYDGKVVFATCDLDGYNEITEDGESVTVCGRRYIQYGMEKNGLYFIQLFNNESYIRQLRGIKLLGLVVNLLIFGCGLIMAAYFTRINYKPLRRVMSRLRVDMSEENEYIAIEKSIENVLSDRMDITKRLRETDKKITDAYTRMLLAADSKKEIKSIVESMQIKFAHRYFAAVAFGIHNVGIIGSGDAHNEKDIEIAGFSVTNVFSELINDDITCDWCMSGNTCFCILNFSRQDKLDDIYYAARDACGFMSEKFGMEIVVYISSCGGIGDLPRMRQELGMLTKPAVLLSDKNCFIYGDFCEYAALVWERNYKEELIHTVESGDGNRAEEVIDGFLGLGIFDLSDSAEIKKILYETVFSVYISLKGEKDDSKDIAALLNNGSLKEAKKELVEALKQFANRNSESGDEGIRDILAFIEENYQNVDLNVSYISNSFNMSISSLSRYFKNSTGEGLADYILKYRCKKAVEYLEKNPEMPVSEIGTACGFYSTGSFIRAFKRIYDVTPGKYNKS